MTSTDQLTQQLLHSIRSKISYRHSLRLARKLIQKNDHSVVNLLIDEYENEKNDRDVKIGIINVLGLFPSENAITLLRRELLTNSDPSIRAAAAISLGRRNDPSMLSILREALSKEQHSSVKRNIVSSLSKLNLPETKSLMKELLLAAETEPSIKAIIIQSIVEMGWKDLIPDLEELTQKETHPKVKQYAVQALKVLK